MMELEQKQVDENNNLTSQPIVIGSEGPNGSTTNIPKFKQQKRTKPHFILISFLVVLIVLMATGGFLYYSGYFNSKNVSNATRTLGSGFIELPKDISVEQANNPTKQQASAIYKQISDKINVNDTVNKNDIVVSLMKDGKLVQPNVEKNRQTSFSSSVAYAQSENKNTYVLANPPDSTFGTWTAEEKTKLEDTIPKAYALCQELLGAPAFNDTVNIYKQDRRAYYAPWGENGTKTIVLAPDDSPDILAHEMAHSFHSDYVFDNRGWEEGMAMLVQDKYRVKYSDSRNMITSESYLDENQPIISTANFYSGTYQTNSGEAVSENDHYFMAGYAMEKVYTENHGYLNRFDQAYYSAVKAKADGYINESSIRDVFTSVVPSVEGSESSSWVFSNYILINNSSDVQRLAMIQSKIIYLIRGEYGQTIPYKNATVSEKVMTLDGTQILNYQLNTDENGIIENSLFGKVPKGGFYKILLEAESKEGAVDRKEYVKYIQKDKSEYFCVDACVFGPSISDEQVVATDPDGNKLVGKVTGDYFQIDGVKPMTKYAISQGDKKVQENVARLPHLTLGLLDNAPNDNQPVSINWETPSDPAPKNDDPKFKPTLVFNNGSVNYDQPYITICASIDGSYFSDSVMINAIRPNINKSAFCTPFDLKDGANEFTIKVTPTHGSVVTSKRTIVKTGTASGSYQDLDNISGNISVTNDPTNPKLAKLSLSIYLNSKKTDEVLKNITYGITANGGYFNPDYDPHDGTPGAVFFKIPELKPVSYTSSSSNVYTKEINLELQKYPFETGDRNVCLIIDVMQQFTESDENDNMVCQNITVQ